MPFILPLPRFTDEDATRKQMGHLHLPPDYFVIAANTLSDADNLARASPDSHAPAFAAQTIRNLDDFIALVENAFQNCETEEMDLTTFHSVLCSHVTALYTRFQIVLDPVDLDRAMYLSDMLRHYCDPTNIQLLAVGISFIASGLCLQTMFQKANDVHESVTVPRSPPSNPSHTIVIDLSSTGPDPQFPPKCDDAQSLARIVEQLDTVIANAEKTISSNNSGDNQELGDLYKALTAQGMALYNRYQVLGSANDLDHSISVLEIASQLRPPSLSLPDVEAWMVFRVRGQSYILRFNRDGNSEDFDAAIEIEEQIVSRRWNISVQESLVDSLRLFSHLADRLEVRGGTGDISRALEVLEDIRPHLSRKERSISSQMISESILKLSILGRKILDLHRIVYILQQMRGDDPGDPTPYICGRFLRLQLKIAVITGDQEHAHNAEVEIYAETEGRHAPFEPLFDQDSISDLDLAIDLLRRRFNSQRSLDESTPHEAYTMLLISALYDRFKRFERSSDLREALAVRSSLGPLGLYCVDFVLLNASMEDFDPFGVQEKSKRAVAIHKSRYPKCPCHRIVKTHPLNTRVPNPPSRYGNKVEPDDHIRRVIVGDQRSMNSDTHPNQEELPPSHISPEDGSDQRSDHMWSLYLSHFQQWLTGTRIEDLEQAVSYAKQVVDGLPDDDQSVRAWKRRSDWASVLFMLHDQTQEIPNSQLRLAHDYFREIVSDPHHLLHFQRLAGVDTWFERLPYLIEENREHVLDMCNLALSLLQEHTWAASNIRSSMDSRYRLRSLIPNAVFLTMLSDPSHIPRAIEILDAGQSLVWSQLSSLRVQLGELSSRDSDLAKRFHQLSSAYEVQAGISVQSAEDASVPHNWDLSRDREKVLEEIRALPGFEGFLKPKTFQQLADFAKNGPLIVLTSHLGGCIATILHRNGYSSRALPMSGDTITNLNQALRKLTKTRGSDDSFLGESNEVTMTSPEPGTSHSVEMDTRSLKRKHPTELMYDVLKVLWKEIAEPVIAQIMDLREGPKGKSKMRDIPAERESRERIWWCCMGDLSFMPIHAAGIYHGPSPVCLSDFFVSSYTPTLGALVDTLERPIPTEVKVLPAIQPSPKNGWSNIYQVKEELEQIVQLVPPENIIKLGDSTEPDFEGVHASVKNVLEKLPEASILHLACHGKQDTYDPLKSGFILANGEKLTIEELMKHRLPNAHTAILSACYTASNDVNQPDESINLASAMLFLGFRSIVATKWPMYDADGPAVANAVYSAFFGRGAVQVLSASVMVDLIIEGYALQASKSWQEFDLESVTNTISSTLEDCRREWAVFTPTEIPELIRRCYMATSTQPVLDEDVETIQGPLLEYALTSQPQFNFSMAHAIDELSRYLRVEKKVPPSRWATFVHIGI